MLSDPRLRAGLQQTRDYDGRWSRDGSSSEGLLLFYHVLFTTFSLPFTLMGASAPLATYHTLTLACHARGYDMWDGRVSITERVRSGTFRGPL
jgi:hypothetical protein